MVYFAEFCKDRCHSCPRATHDLFNFLRTDGLLWEGKECMQTHKSTKDKFWIELALFTYAGRLRDRSFRESFCYWRKAQNSTWAALFESWNLTNDVVSSPYMSLARAAYYRSILGVISRLEPLSRTRHVHYLVTSLSLPPKWIWLTL